MVSCAALQSIHKNTHLWQNVHLDSHLPLSGGGFIMLHVFQKLLITLAILPYLCHIIACVREDFLYC